MSSLLLAGFTLGVIHVLSGPDHLSALATLSVSHKPWSAFSLGVRWGFGHSFGLLLIAGMFIGLEGHLDLSGIEYYGELLVGIFMLLMGTAALWAAIKMRQLEQMAPTAADDDVDDDDDVRDDLLPVSINATAAAGGEVDTTRHAAKTKRTHVHDDDHDHDHACLERWCCRCLNLKDESTRRVASLGIGVVHGIAGPGGILGVMPAVALHNHGKAACYLATFCGTSIVTMGIFAAIYGEVTTRCGARNASVKFALTCVSALFSFLVGTAWLCMVLALGRVPL